MRVLAFLFTVFVGMLASVVTAQSHPQVRLKGGKDVPDDERRRLAAPRKMKARPRKFEICHVTGNGDCHTIFVSENAVQAHLDHGDGRGSCSGKGKGCPNATP
jgi:hypothetical protein